MATEDNLSPVIAGALDEISDRKRAGAGMRAMMERANEFASPNTMRLAGAAMTADGREALNSALDAEWAKARLPEEIPAEVIIGAGFHAADYCIQRAKMGKPKPVVLDIADAAHIGGTFAVSRTGAWWLNSENRAGMLGLPAEGDALNYLPGAMLQAADFDGREFTDNASMALPIRLALAQYARVVPGVKVNRIAGVGSSLRLDVEGNTDGQERFYIGRVIDARGCGVQNNSELADGERVLTFLQLMAKADQAFPTRGMRRVAIIGGGNSALCAAEFLFGIGPSNGMRSMNLDAQPKVDIYAGSSGLPSFSEQYRRNATASGGTRGRYLRLSSYLPSDENPRAYNDLNILPERGDVARAGDTVYVNGCAYTHVIICTGFSVPQLVPSEFDYDSTFVTKGGRQIARRFGSRREAYAVGPAADLPFSASERRFEFASVADNQVAMFRLAGPTAQLAASLS